ncbi:hypothetical protein ACOQFV_02435 [Nocardiopsis changdeensis]|uniref:Uncharacterized protein n=1 Tax=Nocardiopsis changdeensis TaxID=2831969 RepID=A0ABX8BP28_9ACTN|nr:MULTISPECIES: hypothetical protein [Nocardiopsis]QUX22498.1 hypothetical protein KGD84_30010 [Nocardiopsis changdeensis]QYX38440.1 hypothetical protein K1J57_07390 [Nocardiopsis sp. MT53]
MDDDGMAAVRPYLVAHEQRKQQQSHTGDLLVDAPGGLAPEPPADDEWRELADLIRLWGVGQPAFA